MKNYDKSIKYMKNEMNKQTEAHRQPYRDAIEAMEFCNEFEQIYPKVLGELDDIGDRIDKLSAIL